MAEASVKDPLLKFQFRVSISGGGYSFNRIGFQKVGGLNAEYEETKYREGGDNLVERSLPGLMRFEEITLERGSIGDDLDFWNAFMQIAENKPNFRFNMTITLYDPVTNTPQKTWTVRRAWVRRYEQEELDATSNDVLIDRITIAHEGFTLSLV